MVRSPNRNGPPDSARHSRQMVQTRSISACARDQILKPGKWPFRLTGSEARSVVKPEWISPQIERQCARWMHAIGRQQADVRHHLVEVFRDRQRVPDRGALVPQARHQDRRRQQQDFGPCRGVVGGGNGLLERQAGEFCQQPAAQRP
jgi:hypothetical protein